MDRHLDAARAARASSAVAIQTSRRARLSRDVEHRNRARARRTHPSRPPRIAMAAQVRRERSRGDFARTSRWVDG